MKTKFFGDGANIGNLPEYHPRQVNVEKKIKLLDVVALTHDLPEHNLWHGQVGTVVEILADGDAFEVEFSDHNGQMYESLGFHPSELIVLHRDPIRKPTASVCEKRQQVNAYDPLIPFTS